MTLHTLIAVDVVGGASAIKTNDSTGALSDTLKLKKPAHGFHVNTAGTIKFLSLRGTTVTLTVNAGASYSYGVAQVFATGTTLTNADLALLYGA